MFPVKNRLRLKKDFALLFREGARKESLFFRVLTRKNNAGHMRVAVTVSKKTEKSAARRNSMKRKVRHALKDIFSKGKGNYDIQITMKKDAVDTKYAPLKKELMYLCKYYID